MADPTRPSSPTIAQLRAVVQPDGVLSRATAEHWTGTTYMRHMSVYLTQALVRTPISANGVTILMIIVGFSCGPALLLPGIWGPLVAALLAQFQMLLDCSDGEVARWRGTSSPRGIFLDQVGHFAAEGSIGLFLGLRATGWIWGEGDPLAWWQYAFVGASLMAGIWLNKSLNMMVIVARAKAGLDRLPDDGKAASAPPASLVGQLRRLARFVPFHRIYHSIELTLLTLVVGIAGLFVSDPLALDRGYVVVLGVAIWVVTAGHLATIWASGKLRAGDAA